MSSCQLQFNRFTYYIVNGVPAVAPWWPVQSLQRSPSVLPQAWLTLYAPEIGHLAKRSLSRQEQNRSSEGPARPGWFHSYSQFYSSIWKNSVQLAVWRTVIVVRTNWLRVFEIWMQSFARNGVVPRAFVGRPAPHCRSPSSLPPPGSRDLVPSPQARHDRA